MLACMLISIEMSAKYNWSTIQSTTVSLHCRSGGNSHLVAIIATDISLAIATSIFVSRLRKLLSLLLSYNTRSRKP